MCAKDSERRAFMRVMAIDYGDARTGVALSDPTGTIPGRAWVIPGYDMDRVAEALADAARENGAERIVLGYPKNMNDTLGPRAEKSARMAEVLREKTGLEVVLWDERRTTVDAHRILAANGRREKKHRKNVDAVAATLILEGYLGFLNGGL